ncbi:helix-turn-helix domain-containing protein [Oceanobacillus locisalsi]|uniref:Helix-turn-helix domain-containing protein n=1 Tax=Oceanobacillus locisalsi TaxID=546107 RepID=A0ABW3NKC3_9BACI
MVKQAVEIKLSEKQHKILEKMFRGSHTPLHFIQRAQVILMAANGEGNRAIARKCHMDRHTVKLWRHRWADMTAELEHTENENPQALKRLVHDILSDAHRSGRPRDFSEVQIAEIIALACESPEDKGLPLSHWTPSALAKQAEKEDIVEQISARSVGRYLKEADLKPHRHRIWLNPKIEDRETHQKQVQSVYDVYRMANAAEEKGTHVFCVDEKTGIQATEHSKSKKQ